MKASITLLCWSVFMTISGLLSAQQDIPKGAIELKQRNTPGATNQFRLRAQDLPYPGLITTRKRFIRADLYTFDGFRVSEQTLMDLILRDNPSARVFVKQAYKKKVLSVALSGGTLALLGVSSAYFNQSDVSDADFSRNQSIGLSLTFIAAGLEGISVYQTHLSYKNFQKAILIYNNGLSDGSTSNPAVGYQDRPELRLGVSPNGLGICLHF